jgi:hypothetical protein
VAAGEILQIEQAEQHSSIACTQAMDSRGLRHKLPVPGVSVQTASQNGSKGLPHTIARSVCTAFKEDLENISEVKVDNAFSK